MTRDDSLELFPDEAAGPKPSGARGVGAEPEGPLADRMRPRTFEELLGQPQLTGEGSALRSLVTSEELPSLILWGPPGSGKTTLARLLAAGPRARIVELSAVVAGVKEIRGAVEHARHERRGGVRTVLFIDEIHRLNRAQQDVLLPHVEAGTVTLVGATTENPSFEVNAPLLSRCRVLTLEPLAAEPIAELLDCAMADRERGLGASGVALGDEARSAITDLCDGDARRALGLLEAAVAVHRERGLEGPLALATVREASGHRTLRHDRDREDHYNVVSALIKSVRASDPDAALYYLARMLEVGEDPLFIARRLVILASEDIGNADPQALSLATSAYLAVERIGLPEGRIPLAQATTYLACAPKSNASYAALGRAQEAVRETGSLPVPLHLRNAPTGLMRQLGYGRDYQYPHDDSAPVLARNLPDALGEARFYEPKEIGAEAEVAERLRRFREQRGREKS
jgi:putative ATPase